MAVAGFTAGGHAALDRLAALDFDIYADPLHRERPADGAHLARSAARLLPAARLPGGAPGGGPGRPVNEAAVALAYKQCERITRTRARNFYYGIRLLPPRQRSAMCALYAMARRIDDIGDGPATGRGGAAAALRRSRPRSSSWPRRPTKAHPRRPPPGRPRADGAGRCRPPVPLTHGRPPGTGGGVPMGSRRAEVPHFDELVEYCRRVAGTIGRLSLAVYGTSDEAAAPPGRRPGRRVAAHEHTAGLDRGP